MPNKLVDPFRPLNFDEERFGSEVGFGNAPLSENCRIKHKDHFVTKFQTTDPLIQTIHCWTCDNTLGQFYDGEFTEYTSIRIAAFSDTHTLHHQLKVPKADVVVFAGDLMSSGWKHHEVASFGKWFSALPHKHKVFIAGNHDRLFESNRTWCLDNFSKDVIYLENSGVEIDGWKFWGSPYTPAFCNWAFNSQPEDLHLHWDRIPEDTEVLITHGPPYGINDTMWTGMEHLGDPVLRDRVEYDLKLRLHLFGHIHGGAGLVEPKPTYSGANVAVCNEQYEIARQPCTFELSKELKKEV